MPERQDNNPNPAHVPAEWNPVRRQGHAPTPETTALSNEADRPESCHHPEDPEAINQPLHDCDKSPTQETEPNDHDRYDQYGKKADRDFPADLPRP
jgi:hypothetical protein